ncbi:MAG: bacterial transcriptional activator domain-containing protein [Myxococcales bacterium]|nr:bacterial transcriptional activator domain-containing protein [Myxococcales bacterium]
MVPSRLFGIVGVEGALLLGLLLPPLAAGAIASWIGRIRRDGAPIDATTLLLRTVEFAATLVAWPTLILLANGLRIQTCEPFDGLTFIGLGPGLGTVAAALWALLIATSMRRGAVVLSVALPLLALLGGLGEAYFTPAVFAYGEFAGYFPGPLYDTQVGIGAPYLSFRVRTLSTLLAIVIVFQAAWSKGDGALRPGRIRRRPRSAIAAVLCLLATLFLFHHGDTLGHRTGIDHIAKELGTVRDSRRCRLVLPAETPLTIQDRLLEDCDYRVDRAEQALGVTVDGRITAFFFRTPAEKKRLLGAQNTQVAKPWRREVYLQGATFPHPVLFHEIAHVVAGEVGQGPLRIAGVLGGLWPNPGLIEGAAVAIAWDAREGMTPHQWARAMRDLDQMPPLQSIVGIEFLGQSQARAYVSAGSFIRFLMDTRGAEAVRRIYQRGTVDGALPESLSELEREWHAFLAQVDVPEEAQGIARVRFERPSVFSSVCPHTVADLQVALAAEWSAGNLPATLSQCEALLAIDPADMSTRATLVAALLRLGETAGAKAQETVLRDELGAPTPLLQGIRLERADQAWRDGKVAEAHAMYEELLAEPLPEDRARAIEVRALGAADPTISSPVFDILVGDGRSSPTTAVVMDRASWIDRDRADGLGPYLLARQLLYGDDPSRAAELLQGALDRGLPTPRIAVETQRLLGVAHYLSGNLGAAKAAFTHLRGDGLDPALRVEADDWLARIAWQKRH